MLTTLPRYLFGSVLALAVLSAVPLVSELTAQTPSIRSTPRPAFPSQRDFNDPSRPPIVIQNRFDRIASDRAENYRGLARGVQVFPQITGGYLSTLPFGFQGGFGGFGGYNYLYTQVNYGFNQFNGFGGFGGGFNQFNGFGGFGGGFNQFNGFGGFGGGFNGFGGFNGGFAVPVGFNGLGGFNQFNGFQGGFVFNGGFAVNRFVVPVNPFFVNRFNNPFAFNRFNGGFAVPVCFNGSVFNQFNGGFNFNGFGPAPIGFKINFNGASGN